MYSSGDAAEAFRLVDVSEPGVVLPPSLDSEQAMARFHVIAEDGRLVSGAAAFVEVWRHLPGWRWAARAASVPGATPVLEIAYRLFLHLRPTLVKLFIVAQRLRSALP